MTTALQPVVQRFEVFLPKLHAGQIRRRKRITEADARFVVTMCGRRWGKSIDGEEWIIDGALDGMRCGWFAPTYKYLTEVWDSMASRLSEVATSINKTDKRIELRGDGVIECWTLDTPDPGRSRKYHRIVVDEAGIARGLLSIWQQSIRPTLTDYRGHAWFYGTPKGRTHDFTHLFARGESGDVGWLSHRAPTRENPYIPLDEIEAARRDMPEGAYLQEYEGVPSDDGANPFGITAIANCVMPAVEAETMHRVRPIVWGWDFARAQDWTVGVGLDYEGRVCRLERWQGVPWAETTDRVAIMTGRTPSVGDSTGVGDSVVEMIQRKNCSMWGLPFTQKSKQQLMQRLATAIHSGQVRIPDGWLRSELEQFEFSYYDGGVRYSAPSGLHDDGVMALALAVYAKDRAGLRAPEPYDTQHEAVGHDPFVIYKTTDGQAPRWVGPEGDNVEPNAGYASQLPAGI